MSNPRDARSPASLEEPLAPSSPPSARSWGLPARRLKPSSRDWPRELIARPIVARSLPVVAALQGLSRFAAPRTRALVDAIAALAGELDWRQTYTSADFGQRFLDNYGWSEWIGQRGAFVERRDRLRRPPARPGHRISRPFARGGGALSPSGRPRLLAFGPVRLAAARAGEWIHHPSWTTHAMRTARRAPARGLCLARRRSQREIAHRQVSGAPSLPARFREKGTRALRRIPLLRA